MEFNKMMDVLILCILVEICRQVKMEDLITYEVKECPQNQYKWDEAALRLNCSVDRHGQNTYHCVPNQDKTSLVEFCYNRLIGRFQEGYCLQLTKTLFLHSDNCLNILTGCPTESYLSNAIFKYPECQNINTKRRCYITDQECSNKIRDLAEAPVQRKTLHNSSYELSTTNRTTPFISKEDIFTYQHNNIIIFSITLVIFMLIFILIITCIIIKRGRLQILKQTPNTCREEDVKRFTCRLNSFGDSNQVDENMPLEDSALCTDKSKEIV